MAGADPVRQRSGVDLIDPLGTAGLAEVFVACAGLGEAVDLLWSCCSCPDLCRLLWGTTEE